MVRKLRSSDVRTLGKLWEDYCAEVGAESDKRIFLDQLKIMLGSPLYAFMVLEVDGEVVGFTDYMLCTKPVAPYTMITCRYAYVSPEHRPNNGLLFHPMMTAAKRLGVKEIEITCNEDKVGFWSKHKFVFRQAVMTREVK